MKISVIIPTYEGVKLLEKNLPSLLTALKKYDSEIIIVDNGSKDATAQFIKENYPSVELLKLDKNLGFSIACNRGVKKSKGDMLLFLNNDVTVENDFLKPLIDNVNNDVFSLSSAQLVKDGKLEYIGGASYGFFKFGFLKHDSLSKKNNQIDKITEIFYPAGGSCLIDKNKFNSLGGFAEIYSPFYWEDADLGLRAWKRGWKSLIVPESKVVHRHESTAKKINPLYVKMIANRNRIIYNWINLDGWYLLRNIFWFPANIINELVKGNGSFFLSLFLAFSRIGWIIKERLKNAKYNKVSLKEILEKWEKYAKA